MQWFRMYGEFATDATVQILSFDDQRHFVIVLCLKSNGLLDKPYTEPMRSKIIASALGLDPKTAGEVSDRLQEVGLITADWQPVNWDKRQYKSDSVSARVKRYRERRKQFGLTQQCYIRPEVRAQIFARDDHRCVTCESTQDLTIDHVVSELNGGSNDISNLQTLCRVCNARKRDHDNVTFQERNSVTPRIREQITDTEKNLEGEARAPRSARATRLPEDFRLTPERRAIAETEKADPDREFAQFVDHFRAAPGVKGRKTDWDATWRNWCRRAPDFKPRPRFATGHPEDTGWRPPEARR